MAASDELEYLHYRLGFADEERLRAFTVPVPGNMDAAHFRKAIENGPILAAILGTHFPEFAGRTWQVVSCEPITEDRRRQLYPDVPGAKQYAYPSWVDLEFYPTHFGPPGSDRGGHSGS